VKERIEEGILIMPSVKHVQEKIKGTAEQSTLSGALGKQRVSIAEQQRAAQNNPKIIQKYGGIYVYQGRADIMADDKEEANARLAKAYRKDTKIMKTRLLGNIRYKNKV
jgi:hypothetical protein